MASVSQILVGQRLMPQLAAEHQSLFHYTTADGLLGILQTGKLWATHYRVLNDTSELAAFRPHLEVALTKILGPLIYDDAWAHADGMSPGDISPRIRGEVGELIDGMLDLALSSGGSAAQTFLASFCGKSEDETVSRNGLLNLWQTYGVDGGYAIEFSTVGMESMCINHSERHQSIGFLSAVSYPQVSRNWDKTARLFFTIAHELVSSIYDVRPDKRVVRRDNFRDFLEQYLSTVMSLMSTVKHAAFAVEQEVRLVVIRRHAFSEPIEEMPIRYRLRRSTIVPYVELFSEHDVCENIKRIIVGPHVDAGRRADALRFFLRDIGREIEVLVSNIPYSAA